MILLNLIYLFLKTENFVVMVTQCLLSSSVAEHFTITTDFFITYNIYKSKVKLATIVEGNPKAPFSIATTPMCRGGRYSFPGLLYFTLDPYLIMLSVKQGGIKYHFLSLWYDSTWDWTQVSRAIGEHSNP